MIVLRCTNDNNQVQDLPVQENLDLLLDISAIENATIGEVYGISSQEFAIPGTDSVNQFFGNIYNLGATPSVALQNSIECQVLLDGAQVFKGKLYINTVVTDQKGFTIYNVVVVNETVDFKFEIQDKLLAEYDFSRFNHDFTYANVSASWSGNLLNGSIIYPFVEYGSTEDDPDAPNYEFASYVSSGSNTIDNYDSPLRLHDFKPAIKAKDVVDVIFSGSGYDYSSNFFDSAYFNSLYVLTTPDDTLGPTNISPVSQSAWAFNASGSQTILSGTQTKIDFDEEVVDNGNRFDLANDRFTAATYGDYSYQVNISYTTVGWSGYGNQSYANIYLRKNGASVVDSFVQYSVPATGSLFLQGAVTLLPGDYIEVEVAYVGGGLGSALQIRNDLNQPSYYPKGYLTYFQAQGASTAYGGNVDMGGQFPDELKAQDFLEGLIEKFNLVVEPVPNSRNLLRIEPYQDWIDSGAVKDWTNKIDRNVRFGISHPIQEQPRTIIFSDEEDEDILNKYTLDNKGVVYGSYEYVSDSDLANGERRIGKVFAATPVTGIPNGREFIIPHLCTSSNLRDRRPYKFKPRLLYNNGLQAVPQTAFGIQGTTSTRGQIYVRDENATVNTVRFWNQMTTLTSVPVNYNTGQDLHFNNDLYTPYFQGTANGKVKGDAFRGYWATYLNSLYDVDSRKLTCNVFLKPNEIQDIALNDRIFIDGAYFRINKISSANLTRQASVEVELIKILTWKLKFPRRITSIGEYITLDYNSLSVDGGGRYINVDTGATVNDYYQLVGPSSKDKLKIYNTNGTGSVVWDYQQKYDATNLLSQTVIGSNKVDVGASKVTAIGNNNQVKQGSEVSLVVGADNLVAENTSNVTVMGQSHTVSEQTSNAQILGGFGNTISQTNNQTTVINSFDSSMINTDYGVIINGNSADLRDSDFTTAINPHADEVIINGSGHAVIGLNREGAGLDLLNTRANTNWLGDTYLGGALFRDSVQLECGDGYEIILTGSNYTDGRHENLYILNWSGLSPGTTTIQLPSAANNDYKNVVYQFVSNGTFDGTTRVDIEGLSGLGQTINGQSTYSFNQPYAGVTLTTHNNNWITLESGNGGGGLAGSGYGNFYSTASQALATPGVSQSVLLDNTYEANGVSIASGSRIYFDRAGVYQFTYIAQVVNVGNAVQDANFWIKYNGVDYPNSNTYVSLQPRKSATEPNYTLMSATFTGTAQNDNDYIEMYWDGTSTDLSLYYTGSNGEPATPSVIANVIPVGSLTTSGASSTFPYTGSAAITDSLTVNNVPVQFNNPGSTIFRTPTYTLNYVSGSTNTLHISGSGLYKVDMKSIGSTSSGNKLNIVWWIDKIPAGTDAQAQLVIPSGSTTAGELRTIVTGSASTGWWYDFNNTPGVGATITRDGSRNQITSAFGDRTVYSITKTLQGTLFLNQLRDLEDTYYEFSGSYGTLLS